MTAARANARWSVFALVSGLLFMPVSAWSHTLSEVVRAALAEDPAAKAASEIVRAAAFDLLSLEREFLPRLDLTVDGEAQSYTDDITVSASEERSYGTTARVELAARYVFFDGYQRANRVYRGAARLDGSLFRLLDASETLTLSVVQAYIDVARHQQLLSASDANVARHEEIKGQVDELVDGGRLPTSASFEVEQRLLAARLARLEVRRALSDANARFEIITGIEAHGGFRAPDASGLPGSQARTRQLAVENSFRLRSAETNVRAQEYQLAETLGARLPTISASAGARREWDDFELDGDRGSGFVGVTMTWELFAGGRKAQGAAEQARVREAMARRQLAQREVEEFAALAWNGRENALAQLVLLDVQRNAARRIVTQYTDEFRTGNRNLIDLLDAERSLFNVEFEVISARAALTFSGYRLLAASSRLAAQFGVSPSDIALEPAFEARARSRGPAAIFRTEIKALE
ncbi:MAG: TolC family protein [Pseudomonadota bacterium]